MKRILIIALLVLSSFGLKAQQDTEISLYFLNGLLVNPGYTGSKDVATINGWYRHQWSGFDGAPRTANINFHAPLKKNQYALGIQYTNDRFGLNAKNSLYGSFAYRLPAGKSSKISIGLQAGFDYWDSDLTQALLPTENSNPNDSEFDQDLSTFLPNVGTGIYAYSPKKYYVGLSVPHVIPFSLDNSLGVTGSETVSRLYTHAILTAGYVIGKDAATVKFLPSALVKYAKRAPVNFDVTASFLFIERIMLGLSYEYGGNDDDKRGESIIGVSKFVVTNNLEIGYAYDHSLDRLVNVNSGSHELFLSYNFKSNNERFVTPRFINYF